MESWNVVICDDPEGDYVLLNKSRTLIRLSERAKIDLAQLLSKMEEAGVPIRYSEEVKEIYFTHLKDSTHGDYNDGTIRLSCGHESRQIHEKTLVHELAHHIDAIENISDREHIIVEKRKKAGMLPDTYAKKNVGEYIAIGFEVYYFGSREERAKMRKRNPRLWNVIRYLHRKYKSR